MRDGCPFCDYAGPSEVLAQYPPRGVFVIAPMGPVTPGHVILVPEIHIAHAAEDPELFGHVMQCAAEWARFSWGGDCNILSSCGEHATQTVHHLHVHVVPRRQGDGLTLPWGKLAHEHEAKVQPTVGEPGCSCLPGKPSPWCEVHGSTMVPVLR